MPRRIETACRNAANWMAKQHVGNMAHLHRLNYGKKGKFIPSDRMIEACYERKYANMIIEISRKEFKHDQTQFVTGVNWLESAVACTNSTFGLGIKWTDDIDRLPHPAGPAITQWIYDMFVSNGSPLTINVAGGTRQAMLSASGFSSRIRALQMAKKQVAASFCTNYHTRFEQHEVYIRNIWNFNSKFRKSSHRTDTGALVQARCDAALRDGVKYADLSDNPSAAF